MTSEDSRFDEDRELQTRPRSIVRRPIVLAITGGVVALVVAIVIVAFATSGPGGPPFRYPPKPPIPANGPVPKVTPIPSPWSQLVAEYPDIATAFAPAVDYNNNSVSAETYYKAPLCQPRDLKVDLIVRPRLAHPGSLIWYDLEIFNHSSRGCDILYLAPVGYPAAARAVPAARCLPTYFVTDSSGRVTWLFNTVSRTPLPPDKPIQCQPLGGFIRGGKHFTALPGFPWVGQLTLTTGRGLTRRGESRLPS